MTLQKFNSSQIRFNTSASFIELSSKEITDEIPLNLGDNEHIEAKNLLEAFADKSTTAKVNEENLIRGQTRNVNTLKTANDFAKQFLKEAHAHLQNALITDLEPIDLKQTLAYVEKCTRFAPLNPIFYILKGEFYAKNGDLSSATQGFQKAMTCISHCSNYEIEVKIVTEAGDEVITAQNIGRRFMDLTFAHGQAQIKAGQFGEGLKSLRAAMSFTEFVQNEQYWSVLNPRNQQILKGMVDAYIGLNLFPDAINLISQIIQELRTFLQQDLGDSIPRSTSKCLAELYTMRAEIVFTHLRSKMFLVNSDIQYALAQDPHQPAAKQLLAKLQAYGQRLCGRSQLLSAVGRPEDARVLFLKAVDLNAPRALLRLAEVKAHRAAGERIEALGDLLQLSQDPTFSAEVGELATSSEVNTETVKELAGTVNSLDVDDFFRCQSSDALDYVSRALDVLPANSGPYILKKADCLLARGQTLGAIRLYRQAKDLLGGEASLTAMRAEAHIGRRICLAWQQLAKKAYKAGNWKRALDCLSQSLLYAADCPAPWIERAGVNFLLGRKREAVEDTQTALGILQRSRTTDGGHKLQRLKLQSLFSTFCPNFDGLSI